MHAAHECHRRRNRSASACRSIRAFWQAARWYIARDRSCGAGESLEHSTAQGIAKTAAALLFLVQRIVPGSQSQRTADPGEAGMRDIQALHIKAIPTLHQQYFSVLD